MPWRAQDNFRSVVFEEAQVAEGNAPERKDGSYHIHLDSAETLEAVKAAAEAQVRGPGAGGRRQDAGGCGWLGGWQGQAA